MFAAQPKLRSSVDAILHKARTLVAVPRDQWDVQADGRFAKPSAPGSFAFELPQVWDSTRTLPISQFPSRCALRRHRDQCG